MKNDNYQKAKDAWDGYELAGRHQRIHSRIMHCLPPKKQKFHEKLMSQIIKKKVNLSNQFSASFEKLSKADQNRLTSEQPHYLPM